MIIEPDNCHRGTKVYDVDARQEINAVLSIDTDTREVTIAELPVRIAQDGETCVTETLRFRDVWPLTSYLGIVQAVYCYGSLQ